jgi:small-conductance mechanosensitive channel
MQMVRRARRDGGERVFASPVPVKVPVLATVAAVLLSIAVSVGFGLSVSAVLIVAAVVFVVSTVLARRTVSSTLAGVALLVVRPYAAGERVLLHSPVDGCLIEAVVVHVGIANTTLAADTGVLVVPNRRLLRTPPAPAASAEPCPEPCA